MPFYSALQRQFLATERSSQIDADVRAGYRSVLRERACAAPTWRAPI
jgi:hypothetical protein